MMTVLNEKRRHDVCHDNAVLSVGVFPVSTIRGEIFKGSKWRLATPTSG